MGAGSSDLSNSLARIVGLRNKPYELKSELSSLVGLVSLETPLPVKVDPRVCEILLNLLQQESKVSNSLDLHMILQAIQRLFKTRIFYLEAAKKDLKVFVELLSSTDQTIVLSTLNCIAWLLDCRVTCESGKEKEFKREEAESKAKYAFFEYKGYDALCNLLIKYGKTEYVGIVSKVLDILSLDLVDHIQSTGFNILQKIVTKLTPHVQLLLDLSVHEQVSIRAFTSIALSGLLLHGPINFVASIQEKALKDSYILYYIMFSVDAKGIYENNYYVKHFYHKNLTPLARNLLGLLCSGAEANKQTVLTCIPKPLQGQLEDPITSEGGKFKMAGKKQQKEAMSQTLWHQFNTNTIVRVNVEPLFSNLDDEYKLPHIVWTSRMKAELVDQLWAEIQNYKLTQAVDSTLPWNYEAFEITSKYLEKYCRVGNFYVSILIPVLQDRNSAYPLKPELLHQLLSALFQRAVTEDDPSWKLGCLYAISALYERYPEHFKELLIIPYFIYILDPVRSQSIWRDHILRFLQIVLHEPVNAKRFETFGGVQHLLAYINRIHTKDSPQPLSKPLEQLPYLAPPPLARPPTIKLTNNAAGQAETEAEEEEEEETEENGEEEEEKESPPAPAPATTTKSPVGRHSSPPVPAFEIPDTPPALSAQQKGKKGSVALSPQPVPTLKVYKREKTAEEIVWENSEDKENLSGVLPTELSFEEVTARAIRLLRIIAQGGPKLRRSLGTMAVVSCLAKLMLCPVLEIREDGLKLLIELLRANMNLIPHLAPAGFFTFLVYSMRHSFSDQIVELIDFTHNKQLDKSVAKGQSILKNYFPASLIAVLNESGGVALRDAIENDVETPEIIWNQAMRDELFANVEQLVSQYKTELKVNPNKSWQEFSAQNNAGNTNNARDSSVLSPNNSGKLQFASLNSALCFGGVYLKPLNELGERDLSLVSIKSPGNFMAELVKATNSRKFSGDALISILLASAITVNRYPTLNECRRYKAFPVLLALFDQEDSNSLLNIAKQPAELRYNLMQKSSQLLNALLLLEGENLQLAFENKALDSISKAVKQLASEDLSQELAKSSLIHILACLSLLCKKYSPALRHTENDPILIGNIAQLAQNPAQIDVAIAANQVLSALLRSERLQELLGRQGTLLREVLLALDSGLHSTDEEDIDEQRASNAEFEQLHLSAANVLAVLAEKGEKKVKSLLKLLLGNNLFGLLSKPEQFAANRNTALEAAEKERLLNYCREQLAGIDGQESKEWNEWNDNKFSFQPHQQ
jgi:hypothetical protein